MQQAREDEETRWCLERKLKDLNNTVEKNEKFRSTIAGSVNEGGGRVSTAM